MVDFNLLCLTNKLNLPTYRTTYCLLFPFSFPWSYSFDRESSFQSINAAFVTPPFRVKRSVIREGFSGRAKEGGREGRGGSSFNFQEKADNFSENVFSLPESEFRVFQPD